MQIRQVNLLGWVGERHNCGRRWQASSHRAQLPTAGPQPPPLWRPTVPHPTASPPPRHKPCGGSVAAPGCPQTENGAWRPWKTNEADEPRWKAPSACKPACRWSMGVMAFVARPAMALVSSVVRRRLPDLLLWPACLPARRPELLLCRFPQPMAKRTSPCIAPRASVCWMCIPGWLRLSGPASMSATSI